VFTARYALSPYVKQIRFVFKGLKIEILRSFKEYFLWCSNPTRASGLLIVEVSRSHSDTHTACRTPLNEWSARRRGSYLHNTQQPQETHIRALIGFRTRDPSNRTAADLRLRPREHGDRRPVCCFDLPTRSVWKLGQVSGFAVWPSTLSEGHKSLIPWSGVLRDTMTVPQLFKKYPILYWIQRFSANVTRTCHLSLSTAG
jgi:hypothetical protein